MVSDHYDDYYRQKPYIQPQPSTGTPINFSLSPSVTREEFEELKREVTHMKELLKAAKIYDEKNNEPDCEIEEKIGRLREIAKLVGIDLDDVIKRKS